jgi:spore maturation protein A
MIALNMTANIFGLGNAATPFGIKAMEELQKLNPSTTPRRTRW